MTRDKNRDRNRVSTSNARDNTTRLAVAFVYTVPHTKFRAREDKLVSIRFVLHFVS